MSNGATSIRRRRKPLYIMMRGSEVDACCRERGLTLLQRGLLMHLLGEADWLTGVVEDFTPARCAAELGAGDESGRRMVYNTLRQLAARGAVRYETSRGRAIGEVVVVDYDRMVRRNGPDKNARAQTPRAPSQPDKNARAQMEPPDKIARAQTPETPLPPAVLPPRRRTTTEDNYLTASPPGRQEGEASQQDQPATATATEVAAAIAPLVELARRAGLPNRLDDAGRAQLARWSPAELAAGAADVCRQLRAGKRFTSPVGFLVAKARAGDVEFFAVPAPVIPLAPPPVDEPLAAPLANREEFLATLRSARAQRRSGLAESATP